MLNSRGNFLALTVNCFRAETFSKDGQILQPLLELSSFHRGRMYWSAFHIWVQTWWISVVCSVWILALLRCSRSRFTLIAGLSSLCVQMSKIQRERRTFSRETFVKAESLFINVNPFTACKSKCFTLCARVSVGFMPLIFEPDDRVFSVSLIRFAPLFLIQLYSGLGRNLRGCFMSLMP